MSLAQGRSPAKESYLSRSESVDEAGLEEEQIEEAQRNVSEEGVDVDAIGKGIPIRR